MAPAHTALPGQMRPASEITAVSEGGRTHAVDPLSREGLLRTIEHNVANHHAPDREFMVRVRQHRPEDVEYARRWFEGAFEDWRVQPVMQDPIGGFSGSASLYPIALRFVRRTP